MLDWFLTARLYRKIMDDPRYTHKFWSFFWRAALPYVAMFAVVMVLSGVTGFREPTILMLAVVVLLTGCVLPAAQWMKHRME